MTHLIFFVDKKIAFKYMMDSSNWFSTLVYEIDWLSYLKHDPNPTLHRTLILKEEEEGNVD